MKLLKAFLLLFFIFSLSVAQSNRTNFSAGILSGYNNGLGFQINFLVKDFAQDFPFDIKLAAGINYVEPGKALDARKIFINDATNGIPDKSGKSIDFKMDFMLKTFGRNYLFVGPRYVLFTGNFNFIGGNEDFDVTSNQWGVGAGFESFFKINSALDLVFNIGYDHYFEDILYGHDTSYSPDNENVNPRKEFEFDDADEAIEQPKQNIRVMFGLNYNF